MMAGVAATQYRVFPGVAETGLRRGRWRGRWRGRGCARSRGRSRRTALHRSGAGRGTRRSARGRCRARPLLTLAAADDLADPWRQYVHRCDGPAIVVQPHVEGLDCLRVVHHDYRLFRVLLGQIALVLRLQVGAPVDGELELLVRPLENFDRLAVVHMREFRADDPFEFRDQPILDALVEEGEVFSFVQ
jgi:hypothetical protein